ncbi:UNVERIFIED_CONTAM: putative amidohydrolase [Brevibacillus sp. OAP136]
MRVTIALAQLKVTSFNKQLNLNRALATIQACKEKQVDYVLFPELFLSGYFIQQNIRELAEPADGESIKKLQAKAKETGVGVIIGFPERDGESMYNSAAFIDQDGTLQGVYRKVHLFDKEKSYFTAGEHCPLFSLPGGKMGMMMTYDVEFPEMARLYAVNGAALLFVLNAHHVPYEQHQEMYLRARGLENQLFIAAANTVGLQEMTLFFGESGVISPDGDYVARGSNNEELIVVPIDLGDVERSRAERPMKYLTDRKQKVYQAHGLLAE